MRRLGHVAGHDPGQALERWVIHGIDARRDLGGPLHKVRREAFGCTSDDFAHRCGGVTGSVDTDELGQVPETGYLAMRRRNRVQVIESRWIPGPFLRSTAWQGFRQAPAR